MHFYFCPNPRQPSHSHHNSEVPGYRKKHLYILICVSARLWSLRQDQGSIYATHSGTLGTQVTRSGYCGRIPEMWAGRTRSPTAGSCSTDPKWATSGEQEVLLSILYLTHTSHSIPYIFHFPSPGQYLSNQQDSKIGRNTQAHTTCP